jgi:hypothetical protein
LPKLKLHLEGIRIDISAATFRRTLIGAGLSHAGRPSW